uniref:hypothetical protein n=1 Tax=Flavobacterium sp. TaxID=239 RepID=UPI00404996E8
REGAMDRRGKYAQSPYFRGFDSSISLMFRGGIPRPIGSFPGRSESRNLSRDNLSRETGIILVGIILVGTILAGIILVGIILVGIILVGTI